MYIEADKDWAEMDASGLMERKLRSKMTPEQVEKREAELLKRSAERMRSAQQIASETYKRLEAIMIPLRIDVIDKGAITWKA